MVHRERHSDAVHKHGSISRGAMRDEASSTLEWKVVPAFPEKNPVEARHEWENPIVNPWIMIIMSLVVSLGINPLFSQVIYTDPGRLPARVPSRLAIS